MKILFLVRSLDAGGAERQISLLARGLHKAGHDVFVATYYSGGAIEAELRAADIRLVDLRKSGRWHMVFFLLRLIRVIRSIAPDIVYSFLQGPNLVAAAIRPFLGQVRIVWGVRASDMDLSQYGWLPLLVDRMARGMSTLPDLIICNSIAGARHAERSGYPPYKICVVVNGVDTERFKPDGEARARIRAAWGIADGNFLVGLVARLDPVKDHTTFLQAAALVARSRSDVRFVCVGDGPESYRSELHMLGKTLRLQNALIWAGECADMPASYAALDVAVLTSTSEGFPNVILESMATGVPCVATNVGDIMEIVGDTGKIVPPGNPEVLCRALLELISICSDKRDGVAARERIQEKYSVEQMVEKTLRLLERLLGGSDASKPGAW